MKPIFMLTIEKLSNRLLQKLTFCFLLLSSSVGFSQTVPGGLIFQALARDVNGNPAKTRVVYVQSSILPGSASATAVLVEQFQVTTDATGVFSILIGKGNQIAGVAGGLTALDWSVSPYFFNIKISVSPTVPVPGWDYSKSYQDMGTTQFWSVPYALSAGSVPGLSNKLNIADSISKYVTPSQLAAKAFDTASLSNRINKKLNTADSLIGYVTPSQLNSKTFDTTSLNNRINAKLSKIDTTSISNRLDGKEDLLNKSLSVPADGASDAKYPTVKSVKTYVDSVVVSATQDASTIAKGKIKLAGDLSGTADLPIVANGAITTTKVADGAVTDSKIANGISASKVGLSNVNNTSDADKTISTLTQVALDAKENAANKSIDGTFINNSDLKFPTEKAVKTYVATAMELGAPDATAAVKGKIQLAGDLAGSAATPVVANNAITTLKISDGSVTDAKIAAISGYKVNGNITGNSANVTNIVAVANGGSGANALTGFVKGNGTNPFTTVSNIPVADVTGAVQKVNGSTPDVNGNVTLLFGNVVTGSLLARPLNAGTNGNIYVVSSDGTPANDGRTFISDGAAWQEVTSNQVSTDARYVKLSGSTMGGSLSFPTTTKITLTDLPTSSTDAANKNYVDQQVLASTISDASSITKGKLALAGDLTGTADLPRVAVGAIDNAKIADAANIADSKLATISSALKVSNSATTATTANTANSIVARDAAGNFAAGTITATLSGNATNVSGTVAVGNGGTGATSASAAVTNIGAEAVANKSTSMTTDALSTTMYPSVKLIKDYVDLKASAAGVADGSITSSKIADGTITTTDISSAAGITNGQLANSAITVGTTAIPLGSSATTIAGLTSVTSTAFTGALTGNAATATKLAAAKNINGVAFDGSTDITVTAAAGTLSGSTLAATVTSSSLTTIGTLTAGAVPYSLLTGTIPIWNQNTTGNANSATIADNISATSNSTLTNLSNLSTVGTITSGVWSGTAVAVANGGTGATTAVSALTNLGAEAVANKSTSMTTDALSTTMYPSVKLIKDYVDLKAAAAGVADGSITSAKIADGTITTTDISGTAGITNGQLANSSITFGTTAIALGSTATSVAGLTSVSSTGFTGELTGNAATATKLGTARTIAITGDISYTSPTFDGSGNVTAAATIGTGVVTNAMLAGSIDAATKLTGVLPVANGGTGAADIVAARTNLGLGTAATSSIADFSAPLTFSAPLSRSINAISIPVASSSVNGYLSATDWSSFNSKIDASKIAANNGVASLGADGKIPSAQIPAISFSTVDVVANEAAMLALTGKVAGAIVVNTGDSKNYVLNNTASPSAIGSWTALATPASISSVNGKSGLSVSITTDDIAEGTNNKYFSNVQARNAISASAPLAYNAGTGVVSLGTLPAANGGTGLTAVGTNGQILTSNGTSLVWSNPSATIGAATNASNLSGGAAGSIPYQTATNTTGFLSVGTDGQVLKLSGGLPTWAAAPATGMTSLNGSTTSVQTFATPGTTGTAPAWSTASGTHTLNLPMASATSVTAGLLSKADYDVFNAKQAALSSTSLTVGTTSIALGATATSLAGLTSVSSTAFTGALTGNATTATTAGNITATTNTSLTSLANLATVGTITSGTWSGTTIAINKGGTGLTTVGSNGQVLSSNGTTISWSNPAATGITAINGITSGTQTLTVGTTGTAPAFSSATSTHTLNIPMASTTSVTAGLLSKADYDVFNAKQAALTAGSGISIVSGTISATGLTTSNLSSSAAIVNGQLANSATTIGSTAIALGATATTLTGLTSVTSTGFTGALIGNASTATKLAATKNINGVAFDGSADITVAAAAGTLTGTTLAANVVSSSLTTIGTLTAGGVPYSLLTGTVPTWNQSTTGNATTATTAGNITATTNTTLTSLANLATVGTITSGVWSGTAIANNKLANSATTIGTTAISLGTSSTTLEGLTSVTSTSFTGALTGNATTATTAGNITATSNTTLTSLANLATVGTITSGTWSGTTIAIANGGTGSTTKNFVDLTTGQTISGAKIFNGNTSISGANTLTVGTGTTTLGGALGVTGATTLSSTLGVTGATTLSSTLSAGSSTLASATITGNETVGGTLGVTGATTLGSTLNVTGAGTFSSTLSAGATTLASATITGNETVGGTLGVTGATTLSSTSMHIGAATFSSTVNVNGATTLAAVTATGAATFSSSVTIPTGAGANKILTSDANGNATWNANPNAAFRIASTATDNISATTDKYVIYTYAGAGTLTLPAVTSAMSGKEIIIKNVSNYNVTINTTSSQVIIVDFANITATSAIIGVEASNNWIKLIADGTNTRWIAFRALF